MSISDQNDDFLKKYQEIQAKLSEIDNFFSSDAPKNLSNQMLNNYEVLQRVARANYVKIFSFDRYHPLPLTEDQIIESFVKNDVKMINLAPSPTVFQTTSSCIKYIYQKNLSGKLAQYTYSFFKKQPEDLPIFAYITFPSLYGFFLSEDHSKYAYDFLSSLLGMDIVFFLPFFVAYLTSAHVFVEIFWHQFFGLVDLKDRLKPSIAQLYEFLLQALQYSINYLTPFHVLICIQFLPLDKSLFFDCFFRRFLLSTFNAWISYNPGVSSSKVTAEDLDALFSFFVDNPDGIKLEDIEKIFYQNTFSINELYSFVKNSSEPNLTYLLSPKELKIISQLFHQVPELSKVIFDYENFKDVNYNSFVAGSFVVYHEDKSKKKGENFYLIYNGDESAARAKELIEAGEKSKTLENERNWNTIKQICIFDYNVDPYKTLMTCELIDENDNIYEKMAKKKVLKKSSPSLKQYALGILQKMVVDKQVYFETFWAKQIFAKMVDNMRIKLIRYGEIMEELIIPKLKNKDVLLDPKVFPTNIIRTEMVETEDCSKQSFIDCQKNFFESLKHYRTQNPKFSSFLMSRDSFFMPLIIILEKTDELSLGDRFFLLYNIYSQIAILTQPIGREKIFDDPLTCSNALFAYLLVRADFRSFIRTYINVCAFKNKHREKFQMLPPDMIEKWNSIQSFVISVIQDEDFDPQSKLTILTFSK